MKTSVKFVLLAGVLLFSADAPIFAGPRTSGGTPSSQETEREGLLGWWREAKFGRVIHWGLYSVAAGEYNGKLIPKTGEWIMWSAKTQFKEYEKFATGLTASKFDADACAQLAGTPR